MGQAQGRELPYDIGEKFTCLSSKTIWSVHAGKKQSNGEPVTVFVFDYTDKSPEEIKLAQSAHLRLKTLRHPNILKYLDGIELPTSIYVVTEEAVPLAEYVTTSDGASNFSISWGLHQIIKSISFLSNDCGLVHHNVCLTSVFVDEAGEWKLAGVEFMHPHGDTAVPRKHLEPLHKYDTPESSKSTASRRTEKWSTDVWGLGCLLWEVFNGPLHQVSSLRNTNKIPKALVPHYCEMVSANPKSRPNPSNLLSSLREHGGFLANNFVTIALRIEELQIMEPSQRNDFFNELNSSLDSFPESFSKHKILPQLINAFEFGGAGSSVLAPLFKLGGLLKGDQYQKKIVPCVVKLFSSTDRATRLNLLQQLHNFIDHLLPATVNDQIFPQISNGFSDTTPALRELTVKAVVLLAPKLSSSVLNGQLLKHLAKCQLDEQPSIRTNTNICLGKIASYLNPTTRQRVLVAAFMRALKDPFPPARIAAIGSMGATHSFFSTSDLATRILPSLCAVTVDKEKPVRDQAFKTIKFFIEKLEKLSEDPQAAAEQEKIEASTNSWTGWAMSSLTAKFYKAPKSQATPTNSEGSKGTMVDGTQREAVAKEGSAKVRKAEDEVRGEGTKSTASDGWKNEDYSMGVQSSRDSERVSEGGGEVEAGEDSDMEGWEDDGWGTFDSTPQEKATPSHPRQQWEDDDWGTFDSVPQQNATPSHPPQQASSGADFFDNIHACSDSQARKTKNPFDGFGFGGSRPSKEEHTSPLQTTASLFGHDSSRQSVSGGVAASGTADDGEWGAEWGKEFDVKPKEEKKTDTVGSMKLGAKHQIKESPTSSATRLGHEASFSDGWGFEDSSWDTFEAQPPKSVEVGSGGGGGQSKQELLQKKREERRLKQQAAREKRAAEISIKPTGLGTVKKD